MVVKRVISQNSLSAQSIRITPLFTPNSGFDLASRATVLELRAVEASTTEDLEGLAEKDIFGGDSDLSELSDPEEPASNALPPVFANETAGLLPAQSPPTVKRKFNHPDGQSYQNKKRRRTRKENPKVSSDSPSSRAIEQALNLSTPVTIPMLQAIELDAAYGAHTGKLGTKKMGKAKDREREYDVEELVGMGFQHYPWDGITPTPILDAEKTVVSSLVGRPNREGYLQDAKAGHQALMSEGLQANLGPVATKKKRGSFPAFTKGMTMGMGSKTPVLLASDKQEKGMGAILQRLTEMSVFKRMSQYQNAAFKLWGRRLHKHYEDTMDSVFHHPSLSYALRNFTDDNVFAAAAFNFGGKVRTYKHRDHLNWAFGWCAITALGNFDPNRSARLVLWEFKLVVDFPAGSTALIPSAVVTHSNTRIAEGDERTSFTQYTAGAIFRWVENGCMTDGELKASNSEGWSETKERKRSAALERVKLYSTLDELVYVQVS
ncbi:hypothetical protein PM082_018379 [Marasmius tenuissimus]|nr:hypothetical protein PM082_018379 [Marasmius tenuissimus]